MLSFLEQYNKLPYELRDKVSSPEAMGVIAELETKYGVELAIAVMRVMVKDVAIEDLAKFFVYELEMNQDQARALAEEMKEKVFSLAADYLGLNQPVPAPPVPPAPAPSPAIPVRPAVPLPAVVPAVKSGQDGAKPAPAGPEAEKPKADFYFSSEDEEEIKALGKKSETLAESRPPAIDPDRLITDILTAVPVSFSSEDLYNRLKTVLNTYLKGVRNRIDVKQTLLKSVNEGGLGLDLNLVEKLVYTADRKKEAAEKEPAPKQPPKIRLPEDMQAAAGAAKEKIAPAKTIGAGRDVEYDFSRFRNPAAPAGGNGAAARPLSASQPPMPAGSNQGENGGIQTTKAVDTAPNPVPTAGAAEDQAGGKRSEGGAGNAPASVQDAESVSFRRSSFQPAAPAPMGRVKMHDVKYVPKLTGPIDELREMDLTDFRRLSKDPLSAMTKIKEKISNLEDESYAQRLAGIKAWRESPVNRLYLAIGQESISRGEPVANVIIARKSAGQEFLTEQEFLSIMDLNKSLRF